MPKPSTSLALETSPQQMLVVGSQTSLVEKLERRLRDQGVEIYHVPILEEMKSPARVTRITLGSLLHKLQALSPDYYVIIKDRAFDNWLETPEHKKLLDTAEARLTHTKKLYLTTTGSPKKEGNTRQIIVDEVFGGDEQDNTVTRLTNEALLKKQMTIPGDGLQTVRLLHIDDAVRGILEVLLDPYMHEQNILLTSPDEISYLNLAYKIRALLPQKSDLVFGSEEKKRVIQGTPLTQLTDWQPQVDFDAALQESVKVNMKKQEVSMLPQEKTPEEKSEKPTHLTPLQKPQEEGRGRVEFVKIKSPKPADWFRRLLKTRQRRPKPSTSKDKVLKIALITLAVYITALGLAALTALQGTRSAIQDMRGGKEIGKVKLSVIASATTFLLANVQVARATPLIGRATKLQELDTLLQAVVMGEEVVKESQGLWESAERITGHIVQKKQVDIREEIRAARLQTDELYKKLSLLEGALPEIAPSVIPKRYKERYQKLRQDLKSTRQTILAAKATLGILPEILGVTEAKKYAILLQNNMELRPTGGFIGSFAIAEFADGELFNLQVYDAYQADGQLKGHVEPPEEIREHLGEANWFLRDSNWDPDFEKTARRVEWFVDKTIHEKLDGVIGLNLFTIQEVLEALGPVNIPDYQEQITSENLFEKAEYHAEVNFFPGATQKKEFLAALTDALFVRLQDTTGEDIALLARAIQASLNASHTTIALRDTQVQAVVDQLGWSGRVKTPPCPSVVEGQNCVNDYVFIVDANLGINKANFFVRRSTNLAVTIDKNRSISNKLTITYRNTATSATWPAGEYKNYQRIYLPPGTDVTKVTINGQEQARSERKGEEVGGKTTVGYLVRVPISAETTVEVEYTLATALAIANPVYTLYWQKQPGTADDPLTISVNYPLFLEPQVISPQATLNPQQVLFELSNTQDRRAAVAF